MDFSKKENRELFEEEVKKRTEAPFYMSRDQAELLVTVLLADQAPPEATFSNFDDLMAWLDEE
jgi:hypothetical protein